MLRIDPKEVKTSVLHSYLLGAVAPRPIAFASTLDKDGNPNLAPFSFFNVFSANPPIAVFSPSRSGRTGLTKHTFDNIKEKSAVIVNGSKSCEDLQYNVQEYKNFVENFAKEKNYQISFTYSVSPCSEDMGAIVEFDLDINSNNFDANSNYFSSWP